MSDELRDNRFIRYEVGHEPAVPENVNFGLLAITEPTPCFFGVGDL